MGFAFTRIERKSSVLRPALQSNQSSLCNLHHGRDRGGGGPNSQIASVKRAADRRRQRSREIVDEKREKYWAKNGSLRNISTGSKGETFVILINHASALNIKKRLSPTSKTRPEASRNESMKKVGVPERVKRFQEIDSGVDRPRARPRLVKPTQSRPSRAETDLMEERMEFNSRKKSRRDKMTRSKRFDTQEVRNRDRPEGSRRVERLSHFVAGNNRRCLPDGRKEMQRPGKIENVKKKIHARAKKML